jgi:hypothetical protein
LWKQTETVAEVADKKAKDVWDKLSVIAALVASVFIPTIGLVFTITYQLSEMENRRLVQKLNIQQEESRTRVLQLDFVAKLLPALSSHDHIAKRQAHLIIEALGNKDLMDQLDLDDARFGDKTALVAVATSPRSTDGDREIVHKTIDKTHDAKGLVGAPVDPRYGESNEVGEMAKFGYDSAKDISRIVLAMSSVPPSMAGMATHFGQRDGIAPITFGGLGGGL